MNFKAPLFLMQLAIKSMQERNTGSIIAITSIAGVTRFREFFIVLRTFVLIRCIVLGWELIRHQSELQ